MMCRFLTVLPLCLVLWSGEAFPLERTALTLSGPRCRLSEGTIIQALKQLGGIARVDSNLVPDHLVIDHDGLRSGEHLARFVNGLDDSAGCRAAVMQSCITASQAMPHTVAPNRR